MKNKFEFRRNTGITLLALIITVIVMLILAGVTLSMIFGEDGVIKRAHYAAEEQRGATVEEHRDDWKNSLKLELYPNGKKAQEIEELVEDLKKIELITEEEANNILNEGFVEIGSRKIVFFDLIKIGQYVDYVPQDKEKSYVIKEEYSGYFEQNIEQQEFKWRILNTNNDGTIDLISSEPSNKEIYFKGARGYNNGVYLLNDICNVLYGNADLNASARSLNIEDIQDKMLENENGKKIYEAQLAGNITRTYTSSNLKWYPLQWKNNAYGESKQNNLTSYITEDLAKKMETTDLKVKKTMWKLTSEEMKANFIIPNEKNNENIYYDLLCNNGNGEFWLASRYADNGDTSTAHFGLRIVNNGSIKGKITFYSRQAYQGMGDVSSYLRPIVTITAEDIDRDKGYNGIWELK